MKAWMCVPLIALALAGCAGNKSAYRDSCATNLDAAWHELDLAKAEGFAGTVSYSKALSLLTAAKTGFAYSNAITLEALGLAARAARSTPTRYGKWKIGRAHV